MKTERQFLTVLLLALQLSLLDAYGGTMRGRNEGTINIPASNVIGNGNITLCGAIPGGYGSGGIHADPWGGAKVGVAHILQLSGMVTVNNFTHLGVAEAHLQLTTPGNDRLRFFGVAVSGDLYLSTEIDTLSGVAVSGRPDYNAYLTPSFIADVDWMAHFNRVPLKTYFLWSLADDPDLLFRYSQMALRLGFEWKLERNSYGIDFGAGLYKEKKNRLDESVEDPTYKQQLAWIEPSMRYRLFDRASIVGGVRVLLFQRVKKVNPLEREYVRMSVQFEMPIVFKETNSEAIRTMLYVERKKRIAGDSVSADTAAERAKIDSLKISVEGLDLETPGVESESEMMKKREEIQQKMDEIEKLLEDLE